MNSVFCVFARKVAGRKRGLFGILALERRERNSCKQSRNKPGDTQTHVCVHACTCSRKQTQEGQNHTDTGRTASHIHTNIVQRRRGVTFNPQRATNASPMHASPTRFRGVRTEGAGAEGGLGSEGIGIHTYSGALEAPRGPPALRVIGERHYTLTPEVCIYMRACKCM